ncbi:hypothetical protein PSP20601_02951 [Pandoraea sputorum]|uniref:Uncharacterized protein n=1 Tax=Pandoraea sputorum TaxID=93222 RepID=A0A239SD19_9BURK|nr:hypothetical protein NA29_25355 [Pandoraea sputorum]SNU83307.1 Uncharacterised protein [Pandoraea sputorum]VVE17081.1 hypothetical protein PSP20601_02951 [Pandoraea sputorum]
MIYQTSTKAIYGRYPMGLNEWPRHHRRMVLPGAKPVFPASASTLPRSSQTDGSRKSVNNPRGI